MFCNAYHLLAHKCEDIVKESGGLHQFMSFAGALMTDSGGFQIFSLAFTTPQEELKGKQNKPYGPTVLKMTEEGVLFRSHVDGSKILLTPESSVHAQKCFGADILFIFFFCCFLL